MVPQRRPTRIRPRAPPLPSAPASPPTSLSASDFGSTFQLAGSRYSPSDPASPAYPSAATYRTRARSSASAQSTATRTPCSRRCCMNPLTSSCSRAQRRRPLPPSRNSANSSRSRRYASQLRGRNPRSTRRCVIYSRSSVPQFPLFAAAIIPRFSRPHPHHASPRTSLATRSSPSHSRTAAHFAPAKRR